MAHEHEISNPTLDLMGRRRSLAPQFMTGPAPGPEEIAKMLKLAARVPDHGKLAPWRFIVFAGAARERAGDLVATIFARKNPDAPAARIEAEKRRFSQSPLVIAVVSNAGPHVKIPEWEQVMSAGAVCMNLTLAATAMGFASTWLTDWIAYDRDILDIFGLAPHEKIAGFIHIGHASIKPEDRLRPEMDQITRYF
ncbi:MAG: nitroreductase [Hyphomicrobiales bacterium]|nr:nitroreductase [Hyphomicrobiales bacterium]MDE2116003.1 nitroreductase [Hyphomicrobiales bacterium]